MLSHPEVSCIIPTHGRAELILRAIHSAVAQNIVCELIIVENGAGATIKPALEKIDLPPHVFLKYFHLDVANANLARKYGLNKALGHYIQFLDSDDYLLPGKWESQLQHFSEVSSLDVSLSVTYKEVYDRDRQFIVQKDPPNSQQLTNLLNFVLNRFHPGTAAALWKSSAAKILEWPESLSASQDWESYLRAFIFRKSFLYTLNTGYVLSSVATDRISNKVMATKSKAKLTAILINLKNRNRPPIPVTVLAVLGFWALRLSRVYLRERIFAFAKRVRVKRRATDVP